MHHIFIVRHGTTTAVANRIIQGITDSPLSTEGRRETEKTATALTGIHFKHIYSSPIGRARETAEILARPHRIDPVYLESLREMNFGGLEGRKYYRPAHESINHYHRFIMLLRKIYAQVTGETFLNVRRRAADSWSVIRSTISSNPILIVSHGMFIRFFLRYLLGRERNRVMLPRQVRHASITEIKIHEPGKIEILRLDDISHLEA